MSYIRDAQEEESKSKGDQLWARRMRSAKQYFERPEISEAIYLASPGFHKRLLAWDWVLHDNNDKKMLSAFERYLNRMCFRSTPFGGFSTVGYGLISGESMSIVLNHSPTLLQSERAARISGHFLTALCDKLNVEFRTMSLYSMNSSLYVVGDKLRYVELRADKFWERTYELGEISNFPFIEQLASLIRHSPCTISELKIKMEGLLNGDELDIDALIDDLIEAKVLISHLVVQPLGGDPIASTIEYLASHRVHKEMGLRLKSIADELRELEHANKDPVATYAKVNQQLYDLIGAPFQGAPLQVDTFRSKYIPVLGEQPINDVVRDISYLANRFNFRSNSLEDFRKRFLEKYGSGSIPLLEAIDSEAGIGFDTKLIPNPVLDRIGLRRQQSVFFGRSPSAFEDLLAKKIQGNPSLLKNDEIRITRAEVASYPVCDPSSFVPGLHALMSFPIADSGNGGKEQLNFVTGFGPGGPAQWISRFCYGERRLHDAVSKYARELEAADGNVLHAEVSYNPGGKPTNIVMRPQLWKYRISLVEPTSTDENEIPVSDLVLRLEQDRLELWSKRLQKRIIPHLTSAHNAKLVKNIAAYKLLARLETDGYCVPRFGWDGNFSSYEYKPRLRYESIVICPARWQITKNSLESVVDAPTKDQLKKLRSLLEIYKVPRWIEVEEGDNSLVLDTYDDINIDQLLHLAKKGNGLIFSEVLEAFDDFGELNGQPVWRHEVVLPLQRSTTASQKPIPSLPFSVDLLKAKMAEVVYAKIFGGQETLDREVLPILAQFISEVKKSGDVGGWFFIRYNEKGWHLRFRLFPKEGRFAAVLTHLVEVLERLQQQELILGFEFAQYEREIVRYGGVEKINDHELLFCIDSELAMTLLIDAGSTKALPRWMLALLSIDALLDDFDIALDDKGQILAELAAGFKHEFSLGKRNLIKLGEEYRRYSSMVLAALRGGPDDVSEISETRTQLRTVSSRRRAIAARIVPNSRSLTFQQKSMIKSQIHMTCNRIFLSDAREQELVVYDFLSRGYKSLLAISRC